MTVTFKAEGGRLELASVRVGSEVGPVDVDGIAEEAERVARQFDVPPYVGRAC